MRYFEQRRQRQEQRVLVALYALGPIAAWPLSVMAKVGSGHVFVILARFEHDGLVTSERATARLDGGPRRRLYRLTNAGADGVRRIQEEVSS